LESRKTVERAKGRRMQQGKSEEEAYWKIQTRARSERISMRLAANKLLRTQAE
jgi:AmiR/NasT family two-component response regulator